jgi:hypothetical protein
VKPYTRSSLESIGFVGWLPWPEFANWNCPATGGVYVVAYNGSDSPVFLPQSPAGWFKGRDPSVTHDALSDNWVNDVDVIYIGKANNLHRRLKQYANFGSGRPVGHWGGRLIWQLPDPHSMLIAWRETPKEIPRVVEKQMIDQFRETYGKPPFANDPHRLGR